MLSVCPDSVLGWQVTGTMAGDTSLRDGHVISSRCLSALLCPCRVPLLPSSLPHPSQHSSPASSSPSLHPVPPLRLFPTSSNALQFPHLLLGFKLPAWVGNYPISYKNPATRMPLSCHHKESWVLICSPVVPPAAHLAGGGAEGSLFLGSPSSFLSQSPGSGQRT